MFTAVGSTDPTRIHIYSIGSVDLTYKFELDYRPDVQAVSFGDLKKSKEGYCSRSLLLGLFELPDHSSVFLMWRRIRRCRLRLLPFRLSPVPW